jgi:hypothetical protein
VRTLFLLSPSYVTWAPLPVNREREREVLPELIDGRLPRLALLPKPTDTHCSGAGAASAPASRVVDGARVGYMSY